MNEDGTTEYDNDSHNNILYLLVDNKTQGEPMVTMMETVVSKCKPTTFPVKGVCCIAVVCYCCCRFHT